MRACRAFLPCTSSSFSSRRSTANVPDQQSCVCFSGPLPITSDAACPPHFCGLEVIRRAEAAASSVFFSATVWDTGARNTWLRVSSSAPQVSVSIRIYPLLASECRFLLTSPSFLLLVPSLRSFPLPSFLSARVLWNWRVFNSAPQADSPDGRELWEPSSPSLQRAGIAGVSNVLCCSLLFWENLNTVENTWSHTQRLFTCHQIAF